MKNLIIEKLHTQHEKNNFDCGEQSLNIFLKLYAFQQQKKGLGNTYVCIDSGNPKTILAYYTLSASSLDAEVVCKTTNKRFPYKKIPSIKIGRLARDINQSPKGFGKTLLQNALLHCLDLSTTQLGIYAVEVDLISEAVKPFYKAFGFCEIPGLDLHLILPITTIKASQGVINENFSLRSRT